MYDKKCKVVMLPTNKKAGPIIKIVGDLLFYAKGLNFEGQIHQHLYILSDDEIKESDWYWSKTHNEVFQSIHKDQYFENEYKIIATTDSLILDHNKEGDGGFILFPSPSKSFIEKYVSEYNKRNVITEVIVEYEDGFMSYNGITLKTVFYEITRGEDTFSAYNFEDKLVTKNAPIKLLIKNQKLKIAYKDNTIIIKNVKDSWTRDEVIELFKSFNFDLSITTSNTLHNWLDKNL